MERRCEPYFVDRSVMRLERKSWEYYCLSTMPKPPLTFVPLYGRR